MAGLRTGRVIAYSQLGGFGSRLAPLSFQLDSASSLEVFNKRKLILPFNNNSYRGLPKPVLPYFESALSEPLLRRAVEAGVQDVRATIHNTPQAIVRYYKGRALGSVNGKAVYMDRFLYEHKPLDTSGGIVRDVMAGIRSGSIKPHDTILVLGGDIRTDVNIKEFLAEHDASKSDISIVLADVERSDMYRFGAALREGDTTPEIGSISLKNGDEETKYSVFGELRLNKDKMAKIERFFEKAPKLVKKGSDIVAMNDKGETLELSAGKDLAIDALKNYKMGALSPTTLQNGSVYAIRAELIAHLAPLVFNLSPDASADSWEMTDHINIRPPNKFSDFGGDWFMMFTGGKSLPEVNSVSSIADVQRKIIEDLQKGMPQIYGYKHTGEWSDDGTLHAVLYGHHDILCGLNSKREKSSWPINWMDVKGEYADGVITMSNFNEKEVEITPPVFIGPNVNIQPGAKIGPYAIIGRGWTVAGQIEHSVLFPMGSVDEGLARLHGWDRFVIPKNYKIYKSLIGSGMEKTAIDENGKPIPLDHQVDINEKVVVSNGSQNVISDLGI